MRNYQTTKEKLGETGLRRSQVLLQRFERPGSKPRGEARFQAARADKSQWSQTHRSKGLRVKISVRPAAPQQRTWSIFKMGKMKTIDRATGMYVCRIHMKVKRVLPISICPILNRTIRNASLTPYPLLSRSSIKYCQNQRQPSYPCMYSFESYNASGAHS